MCVCIPHVYGGQKRALDLCELPDVCPGASLKEQQVLLTADPSQLPHLNFSVCPRLVGSYFEVWLFWLPGD